MLLLQRTSLFAFSTLLVWRDKFEFLIIIKHNCRSEESFYREDKHRLFVCSVFWWVFFLVLLHSLLFRKNYKSYNYTECANLLIFPWKLCFLDFLFIVSPQFCFLTPSISFFKVVQRGTVIFLLAFNWHPEEQNNWPLYIPRVHSSYTISILVLSIVREASGAVKGTVYTLLLVVGFGLAVHLVQVSLTVFWARGRRVEVVLCVCMCVLVWLNKYAIKLIN